MKGKNKQLMLDLRESRDELGFFFIEKKKDSHRKAKKGKDAEPTVDSIFQRILRLRVSEEERRLGEGV